MPSVSDMQNIKQYLKDVGITQKEFAERIGLSRPTLDTYIDMYEHGQTIPKERYDIIFKRLFDNENNAEKIFFDNLKNLEGLLKRDRQYGTSDLEPKAADYVSLIVRNMNHDFRKEGWNKDVYTFINILITNYRSNEVFQQLVEYFIVLNGIKSVESIKSEQIPYFANLFKIFHNLCEHPSEYVENDYKAFLSRCEEIKKDKTKKADKRKNNLKNRIQNMITDYEKKGIELTEEEIIEEIKKQLIKEKMDKENEKYDL